MNDSIWFAQPSLEEARALCAKTATVSLGIEITAIGPDYVRGTMPVDQRTVQPFGLLHGGCNVVLAETLGSLAANFCVDSEHYFCVGQEVNANHLRAVRHGTVTGTARCLHRGRRSQVWEIHIKDEQGRLSCVSRLTMAVVARDKTQP